MGQRMPAERSPAKYDSVLLEMRQTAPFMDMFYLSGFKAELGDFVERAVGEWAEQLGRGRPQCTGQH